MHESLFVQGLELMLYGMGTVVIFLSLLVLATSAMSRFISRHFAETSAITVSARPPATGKPQAVDDSELVAVISAAVQSHRQRRGR
ncbi:OadG family protein [Haliea sp. E17]|uniref:OadG family protein n=1 Tax=Haliea sp. E17 TaxID=3401576 RepID=UPI003AACF42E